MTKKLFSYINYIDYNELVHKPTINGVVVEGDLSLEDLGIDCHCHDVFRYKGSVGTYDLLPTKNNEVGDVWNVVDTGANYVWNGTGWDKLSETFDLSGYAKKEDVEKADALITATLNAEILRSKEFDQKIDNTVNNEIIRATSAENTISGDLQSEISRALTAEQLISTNVSNEIVRATTKETDLFNMILAETTRALGKEEDLDNAKADKAHTLAGYDIADAYTKSEIDSKISSVYRYRGTVDTYEDLPTERRQIGDTYYVKADGISYVWSGTQWDKLSEAIDLSVYYTKKETDGLLAELDDKKTMYAGEHIYLTPLEKDGTNNNVINVDEASETKLGVAKIATSDEVSIGVDDSTIITPLKLKASTTEIVEDMNKTIAKVETSLTERIDDVEKRMIKGNFYYTVLK